MSVGCKRDVWAGEFIEMQYRQFGQTQLQILSVAMGCWVVSGLTSLDVSVEDSLATPRATLDSGINFLDTAWSYGISGDLIARVFWEQVADVVIATKGGLDRTADGREFHAAAVSDLVRQCEGSLRRLRCERMHLYYLHAADPSISLAESAGATGELIQSGKVRFAGASNLSLVQLREFHAICPPTAVQPAYSMPQREIGADVLPWCLSEGISVCVYWPLMNGLLSARLSRDHVFSDGDGRKKYPMFQGEEWHRNQDLVDELRELASGLGISLTTLVVARTLQQSGVTAALCCAKQAWQISESAAAGDFRLAGDVMAAVERALSRRGAAQTQAAV